MTIFYRTDKNVFYQLKRTTLIILATLLTVVVTFLLTHSSPKMKTIQYTDTELNTLDKIKGKIARRLIYNFIQYKIDFDDFYIQFDMDLESGISKSGTGEIKYTKPKFKNEKIQLDSSDEVIAENIPIDDIDILQTILYWQKIDKEKVEPFKTGNDNFDSKVADLLKEAYATTEEIMVKPTFFSKLFFNNDFIYLVDVGIRIKSKDKYLIIAPTNNAYGFHEKSFRTDSDFKEWFDKTYKFTKR